MDKKLFQILQTSFKFPPDTHNSPIPLTHIKVFVMQFISNDLN